MLLLVKYFQNCQARFGRSECKWVKTLLTLTHTLQLPISMTVYKVYPFQKCSPDVLKVMLMILAVSTKAKLSVYMIARRSVNGF